jgi:hypothetical protein
MGIYTFEYNDGDNTTVRVSYNDDRNPSIDAVLVSFEQFLLGVTFQPESIAKYLDMDTVRAHQEAVARIVAEHTANYGGTTNE